MGKDYRCEFLFEIYDTLLKRFGPQGWWPVKSRANSVGFDEKGYHSGNYSIPSTDRDRFEIIVGAILTQNTTWKNVEVVLDRLIEKNLIDPLNIVSIPLDKLANLIRSSGYYNQKAKKLKAISEFFISLKVEEGDTGGKKASSVGDDFSVNIILPDRDNLLSVWGVGKETADSILLYAFNYPVFVIDAYTKRFVITLNDIYRERYGENLIDSELLSQGGWYDLLQNLFHSCLPHDYKLYNEYHALIVRIKGRL